MTISLTVVFFELTGAVTSVLSIMIAVMVSKFTGDFLARDGIYESWIKLRSYPFLDPKVEYRKDTVYARDFMTPVQDLVVLDQLKEWKVGELEDFIRQYEHRGYPVVHSEQSMLVSGYIVRNDLIEALSKARIARGIFGTTRCSFLPRDVHSEQPGVLDLAPWLDQTPMTMSVNSTGEVVVQLFQRMVSRISTVMADLLNLATGLAVPTAHKTRTISGLAYKDRCARPSEPGRNFVSQSRPPKAAAWRELHHAPAFELHVCFKQQTIDGRCRGAACRCSFGIATVASSSLEMLLYS